MLFIQLILSAAVSDLVDVFDSVITEATQSLESNSLCVWNVSRDGASEDACLSGDNSSDKMSDESKMTEQGEKESDADDCIRRKIAHVKNRAKKLVVYEEKILCLQKKILDVTAEKFKEMVHLLSIYVYLVCKETTEDADSYEMVFSKEQRADIEKTTMNVFLETLSKLKPTIINESKQGDDDIEGRTQMPTLEQKKSPVTSHFIGSGYLNENVKEKNDSVQKFFKSQMVTDAKLKKEYKIAKNKRLSRQKNALEIVNRCRATNQPCAIL